MPCIISLSCKTPPYINELILLSKSQYSTFKFHQCIIVTSSKQDVTPYGTIVSCGMIKGHMPSADGHPITYEKWAVGAKVKIGRNGVHSEG